jgi:hypothetical protein
VIGIDRLNGDFSEDATTTVINRTGGRITLKANVAPGDTVRIVNLESHSESDFRIVGPTKLDPLDPAELGVECLETDRNLWSIEFPPPFPQGGSGSGALLVCRVCNQHVLWALSLTEIDVLDSTGQIPGECMQCRRSTYWTYGETTRRPRPFQSSEPTEPPPPIEGVIKQSEKRNAKRLGIKMPLLIRSRSGNIETAKTENFSQKGFAANLALELHVGEIVTFICPFTEGGQKFEQQAEVRRCPVRAFGGMRLYGFRTVS